MKVGSLLVNFVLRPLLFVCLGLLAGGCAALAPVSALIDGPHGSEPGLEVHEQTSVDLAHNNFSVIRTNVVGRSRGFSLLGFITIYPATLTKAMSRMYAAAHMLPGQPQSTAHLLIEHSSSYFILFGIPKVEVRADIVEFRPEVKSPEPGTPRTKPPDRGPPDPTARPDR